jgi:hypothetical protein
LNCDWVKTSEKFWLASDDTQATAPCKRLGLENHALNLARRTAYWSITLQWLSGQDHIIIPADLKLGVIPWPAVRAHWSVVEVALKASKPINGMSRVDADVDHISPTNPRSDEIRKQRPAIDDPPVPEQWLTTCEQLVQVSLDEFDPESLQVIEIRSANDSQLVESLEQQLVRCRTSQGYLTLVVVRELKRSDVPSDGLLNVWQKSVLRNVRNHAESSELRGFITPDGDLAIMLSDLDRTATATLIRFAIQSAAVAHIPSSGLVAEKKRELAAGVGSVGAPARSFRIEQLTDAAWRCLDGASLQGSGTVKTIEVF